MAGVDADVVGAKAGATADKAGAGAGRLDVARQMMSVPVQQGCLPSRWRLQESGCLVRLRAA